MRDIIVRTAAILVAFAGLSAGQPAAADTKESPMIAPLATVASRVNIQRVVSPGGIEAWLVEQHMLPILAVEVAFRGGSSLDPNGRDGTAYMLSGLLDEGAGDMDSDAFQTFLKDRSIGLSFDADRDAFYGSLRTLTEYRDDAIEAMRLALTEARIDQEPLEKVRDQITVALTRELSEPQAIARNTLFHALYPADPYGKPVKGTPETVAAITRDDLAGYAKSGLARDNIHIAVVGDIDAATLGPLLDKMFGALPEKSEAPLPGPVKPLPGIGLKVVDFDVPQSTVLFAGPGFQREDPDFMPAFVLNHILGGGGFSSRLMEEVREKRGLAYSVSSQLLPLDRSALVLGGVGTQNARVAESLKIIREQLADVRANGVSPEELADAKTYLTGSFALRFDTNSKVANQLVGFQIQGYGINYINERNALIEAVTIEDIKRAANRFPPPEELAVIVVGKPEGL